MEQHIMEVISRVRSMAMECLNGMIIVAMKEIFLKMKFKEKENTTGNL